jgi:hypothetical protein
MSSNKLRRVTVQLHMAALRSSEGPACDTYHNEMRDQNSLQGGTLPRTHHAAFSSPYREVTQYGMLVDAGKVMSVDIPAALRKALPRCALLVVPRSPVRSLALRGTVPSMSAGLAGREAPDPCTTLVIARVDALQIQHVVG